MKKIILFSIILLSCAFVQLPTVTVPDDYPTLQAAIDALPSGGTVILKAGTYSGLKSYGTSRTASIVINGNRNIVIQGEPGAIVTYDPETPPTYYGEWGVILLVSNAGQTTIDGVHFVGTRSLGDPLYDLDVCIYSIANAPLTVRNSEIEQCGHAGIKHAANTNEILIENNRFHDNGFTTRDHHIYMPGGAQYVIRFNHGWNASGYCVGYGNAWYTTGAQIYGNTCVEGGGGIVVGWGQDAVVYDNLSMFNDRGLWLEGSGSILTNNVFLENTVEDIYSERADGGNLFFDRGNLYETVSHPDRIE